MKVSNNYLSHIFISTGPPTPPCTHTSPSTGQQQVQLAPQYDTDAFDSMAVVNSEAWSESGHDEKRLTRSDLLPHVGQTQSLAP